MVKIVTVTKENEKEVTNALFRSILRQKMKGDFVQKNARRDKGYEPIDSHNFKQMDSLREGCLHIARSLGYVSHSFCGSSTLSMDVKDKNKFEPQFSMKVDYDKDSVSQGDVRNFSIQTIDGFVKSGKLCDFYINDKDISRHILSSMMAHAPLENRIVMGSQTSQIINKAFDKPFVLGFDSKNNDFFINFIEHNVDKKTFEAKRIDVPLEFILGNSDTHYESSLLPKYNEKLKRYMDDHIDNAQSLSKGSHLSSVVTDMMDRVSSKDLIGCNQNFKDMFEPLRYGFFKYGKEWRNKEDFARTLKTFSSMDMKVLKHDLTRQQLVVVNSLARHVNLESEKPLRSKSRDIIL